MGAREDFEGKLLQFIRKLCEMDGIEATVERDTPLFESQLIDSRRVVDLMEFVEQELAITIPDSKLSMQFFRCPSAITQEFAAGDAPAAVQTDVLPLLTFGKTHLKPTRCGVDAMVERGEITAGDNGCVAFRGLALELHHYFARLFAELALRVPAAPRRYPTLLPLSVLEKTDYFKSFPQHATFCTCLNHDERTLQSFVSEVKDARAVCDAAASRLEAPSMVLSSAVCYQCYREFAGRRLETSLTRLTAQGQCFRNERGAFRTLDRLYEFTMREVIMLGDPVMIDGQRMKLLHEVVSIAESLGLAGTVETATDFFFRGDVDGRARALHQRANALKLELRVRMDEAGGSLAVASFNLHEDYFGRSFDITLPDGGVASTGCVGFGIERWVSAFLAYHGADVARWPVPVRDAIAQQRRRGHAEGATA